MDQEYKDYTREDLIQVIRDEEKENFDLVAKVVELINVIGWDDNDCYVFNDGDNWYKFDPLEESIEDE